MNNPCIDLNTFIIYNRWGKKLFEADGSQHVWDGLIKWDALASSVLFMQLNAKA